jgi:hypothetical protein
VPGKIQLVQFIRSNRVHIDAVADHYFDQIFPVQYVEPDKRPPSALYFFHGGHIQSPPGVSKLESINWNGVTAEEWTGIASDTASPIDDCAKDIEQEGFDCGSSGHFINLSIGELKTSLTDYACWGARCAR